MRRLAPILVLVVLALACGSGGSDDNDPQRSSTGGNTTAEPDSTSTTTGAASTESSTATDSTSAPLSSEPPTTSGSETTGTTVPGRVAIGAEVAASEGFPQLVGRRVGLIANNASMVGDQHVVDLLDRNPDIELVGLFSPEHGFRLEAGSGAAVDDEFDPVTGLPIFSLYGDTRAPTPEMLADLDVLVFDMQDVGARYYTYISTMGLSMSAAARAGVDFVVFDRPNPNGGTRLSGAVRDPDQVSFVSQYPIPSVYGMTAGELALMIKAEGWVENSDALDLTVIGLRGWDRSQTWDQTGLSWVAPSPGLPTSTSALTYPALVLFETTTWSYGQGSDAPFTRFGVPGLDGPALSAELNDLDLAGVKFTAVEFVPQAKPYAPEPRFEGELVSGVALQVTDPATFDGPAVGVHLLAAAQRHSPQPIIERPSMFDLLAGSSQLRRRLAAGDDPADIIESWQADLATFDRLRRPHLLY